MLVARRRGAARAARCSVDSTWSLAAGPASSATRASAKSSAVPGPREVITPASATTASSATVVCPAPCRNPG
jgi:hypothetical protein